MRYFVIFGFLLISANLFSQDSCKFYFDKHNLSSTVDSFDFFRIAKFDSLGKIKVCVKEFYKNGSLKLTGVYSRINKDSISDLTAFGVYSVNEIYIKDGIFKEWDENGKLFPEVHYIKGQINGKPVSEEKVFIVVEENATFHGGGLDKVRAYVVQNIKYPSEAAKNKIQGRVIIEFTVGSTGNVIKVKVLKNIDPTLDKEAVRVIESMPKWKPCRQEGKTVSQKFVIPIDYRLKK